MSEIWKDIKGYEGLYQASNLGRIKSLRNYHQTGRILKTFKRPNGYLIVTLCNRGKQTTKSVHRLVAETFIEKESNKDQVNHKNGNKEDNRVDNLEWCTCKENINHAWENGLSKVTKGMREHCKAYNIKINQYNKDMGIIKQWESASQAGRELNIFQQAIVNCLKGRSKTAGGFIWKYSKED